MMTTCASCVASLEPLPRQLPSAGLVVPAPAPRPLIRAGDDARLVARRALDYGDANAQRLEQARAIYEAVRAEYDRKAE
jgi:hypothetical protein